MEDNELRELLKAERKNRDKIPYGVDIIDELWANENAHTRILIKFLGYMNNGNTYPFLDMFLKRLRQHCPQIPEQLEHPAIQGQYDYIDALVIGSGGYRIIIENKIQGAIDQPKQIERYFDSVLEPNHSNSERIFCVYLTNDGSKEVSTESLTPAVQEKLGFHDHSFGRFIPLNYRDDILPLLRDFLHLVAQEGKERVVEAALVQYIDYLEGRFSLRASEKEYHEAMQSDIGKILGIDLKDPLETWKKLQQGEQDLQNVLKEISNHKQEIVSNLYEEQKKGISDLAEKHRLKVAFDSNGMNFFRESWQGKAGISVSEYKDGMFEGVWCSSKDDPRLFECLKKKFVEKFPGSDWAGGWPCWKWIDQSITWDEWVARTLQNTDEMVDVVKQLIEKYRDEVDAAIAETSSETS